MNKIIENKGQFLIIFYLIINIFFIFVNIYSYYSELDSIRIKITEFKLIKLKSVDKFTFTGNDSTGIILINLYQVFSQSLIIPLPYKFGSVNI